MVKFFGQIKLDVEIPENSSKIYFMKELTGFSISDHLFSAKLISNEEVLASNIYYFLPVKDLQLPEVEYGARNYENRKWISN